MAKGITKQTLETLPVLDVVALTLSQLAEAVKLFDEMSDKPLRPVNEIDKDTVRKELDREFGKRVLGLPDALLTDGRALDLLRQKLGKEPSIRGSKKSK